MTLESWGSGVTEETVMMMFILVVGCWFFFCFVEPYLRGLYEEKREVGRGKPK